MSRDVEISWRFDGDELKERIRAIRSIRSRRGSIAGSLSLTTRHYQIVKYTLEISHHLIPSLPPICHPHLDHPTCVVLTVPRYAQYL